MMITHHDTSDSSIHRLLLSTSPTRHDSSNGTDDRLPRAIAEFRHVRYCQITKESLPIGIGRSMTNDLQRKFRIVLIMKDTREF